MLAVATPCAVSLSNVKERLKEEVVIETFGFQRVACISQFPVLATVQPISQQRRVRLLCDKLVGTLAGGEKKVALLESFEPRSWRKLEGLISISRDREGT